METESEMRVIAGKARRLNLKTIPGIDTRPTTDRIKETLFNILQPELLECRFLDLFSGSGGIGIEALSRGASYAVFVEKNPKAAACIRENLAFTKLAEDGKLLNMDVLQALRSLEGKGVFDIIFMDPPYNNELERQVLEYLKDSTTARTNAHTNIIDLKIFFVTSLHFPFYFFIFQANIHNLRSIRSPLSIKHIPKRKINNNSNIRKRFPPADIKSPASK